MANVLSAAIQRSQAESRMRQAERLAGIGQMITGLAHESRNALQRIQACTEMMQLEMAPDATGHQWISRIGRALDDLNRLFDEVRNYAAPMVLERYQTELAPLWDQAWSDVRQVHSSRRLELRAEMSHESIKILGDAYRLGQVFRNLFENTLAACEDPVRVTISAQEVVDGSRRFVRIRVSDNGPGIDERHLSRVFDPFFTTKTKGTGLGLSICRRIVEAHGGTISIEATSGTGAHFTLRLPKG
jgi:signal transduction histidine kinase